jgi:serine phosphatase RsbU (regulator of sigma subunit)
MALFASDPMPKDHRMNMRDLPPQAAAPAMVNGRPRHAGDLMIEAPVVSTATSNAAIRRLLLEQPLLETIPVVDHARPVGLITRDNFLRQMAQPFAHEVFGRKSCAAFMDHAPLTVERRLSIADLGIRAVEAGDKTLKDGFIVTDDGRYAGVGMGFHLVRALSDLQVEKNRLVTESIDYASVIQRSFLSNSRERMATHLDDHFLTWQPRDVVGGDCYYFARHGSLMFVAIIDCTGHGVPGAFMTLIAASLLEQAVGGADLRDPAAVLQRLNRLIKSALRQEGAAGDLAARSDDGLDAAFFCLDATTMSLTFAGAKTPLFKITGASGGVEVLDGNRKGVGYVATPMDQAWVNQTVAVAPGDAFYCTTDGIIDQPGGPRRIAFGKKRLAETLAAHHALPMPAQEAELLRIFGNHQGDEARRDDVTMIGFRVTDALLATLAGGTGAN